MALAACRLSCLAVNWRWGVVSGVMVVVVEGVMGREREVVDETYFEVEERFLEA